MLEGLRVLDLCDESGWLAGKILGDMGADVIKIEPPGGDLVGRRGPYLDGVVDPERSLAWLALNTSKRGIQLDLARERETFLRLVAQSDVLLEIVRARPPRVARARLLRIVSSEPAAGALCDHALRADRSAGALARRRPDRRRDGGEPGRRPAIPTDRPCAAACRPPTTTAPPRPPSAC